MLIIIKLVLKLQLKIFLSFSFLLLNLLALSQNCKSPIGSNIYLSGTFGELRNNHFHTGIDIKTKGKIGEKIFNVKDGFVSRIKISSSGYGKALYIEHNDGTTSVYAHLEKFNEEIEKYIKNLQYKKKTFQIDHYLNNKDFFYNSGDLIAISGNTGSSAGPHLHFEIRDTETQKPINPLSCNIEIKDEIAPVIKKLKVYFLDLDSSTVLNCKKNNNYYIKEKIQTNGKIAFGVNCYDQHNGSRNINGVYSIDLYCDNVKVYRFEANKLDFSKNRYINNHIDYYEKHVNRIKFHKCYVDINNTLENYVDLINRGIINSENKHEIRIEISDYNLNTSVLEFDIENSSNIKLIKKENEFKRKFYHDRANVINEKDFQLHMKKKSLYRDIDFDYQVIESENQNRKIYKCHYAYEPLHKEFVISIKANKRDKNLYVAKIDNGKLIYIGNKIRGNFVSAKSKSFGEFCLAADSINPKIFLLNRKNLELKKNSKISFKIKDNESGIKNYEGKINDRWVLFEYDLKKNKIFHEIDSTYSVPIKLDLTVTDNVGNKVKFSEILP